MSFARSHTLLAGALIAGALAAHAETPTVKTVEAKPLPVAYASVTTRGAVLSELHTAFAEGDRIGTLRSGSGCTTATERGWSPLVQRRVEGELAQVFNDELARHARLPAGSAAAPVRVQAFLNDMDVQVCQAATGAWQGGFYVQVSWQVVSTESGQIVYQASTEGSFTLKQPQHVATAAGLREAFAMSVRNLLADRRFTAMLQADGSRRLALAERY